MSDYEKDHCVFDEFGLVSVHCICCNTVIRKRVEVPSKVNPALTLHSMMTLSNYREREVKLSDGTFMYPMFCADCVNKPMDAERTMEVVKNGWDRENRAAGRPEKMIQEFNEKKKGIEIVSVGNAVTEKEREFLQENL